MFKGDFKTKRQQVNQCSFRHSSRKRPLNDSMEAFWFGLPGSIRNSFTPRMCAQVSMAWPQNSLPLSVRIACGSPRQERNPIQDARQGVSANRPLRHDGHGLMRGIDHHGQVLDHPSFGGAIEHEVHRTDLIGSLWPHQGLPVRHRHLLAFAPLHLQSGFGMQPFHPFVIDLQAGLTQLQVNHS